MAEKRVKIVAECVCDLPQDMLREYDIDRINFLVETDSGVFTDLEEITARNIFDYISATGGKLRSFVPEPEVYRRTFEKHLERFEEVVLVAISSKISRSCASAEAAVVLMGDQGKRVHIFDSGHLSTGLGFLVLRAGKLAAAGAAAEEIVADLSERRELVTTSFIARDAEYLYRNGKISKNVWQLCSALSVHPILAIRNGSMVLHSVAFGSYEKACRRYIRKALHDPREIDLTQAFITHVGCGGKAVQAFRYEVMSACPFETLTVTKASATVSCSCGPGTVGILFMKKALGGGTV